MKEYYELSFIDDFGNGSYQYYFCTEQQIKEKSNELFNSEIKNVIKEEDLNYSTSDKTFEFNKETCKGYITKNCGFILAHHIEWTKLNIDPKNHNVRNIYILFNQSHLPVQNYLGLYTNIIKAKKQLKELLDKPNNIAVKNEDDKKLPNGKIKKIENGYVCSYFYWNKTSYEYDEYDIESNTNILLKKEINRLQ